MDPKINGYQRGLASMVYNFFDERTKGLGLNSVNNSLNNKKLAEKLHKPIIKTLKEETFVLVLKIIFGVLIWLI